MATTAGAGERRRRALVLAALGVLLVAAAIGVRAWTGRADAARSAPAAVLADASDVKGLALVAGDELWWVPPDRSPSRWLHLDLDDPGLSRPVWAGDRVVVAGAEGFVIAGDDAATALRVPYPPGLAIDVPWWETPTAVALADGRIRIGYMSQAGRPGARAVVLTTAGGGIPTAITSFPSYGDVGSVALAPDGARVAFVGAALPLRLVTAQADGGASRPVPGPQRLLRDERWTRDGLLGMDGDGRPILVDPETGREQALDLGPGAARAPGRTSPAVIGPARYCDLLPSPLDPVCVDLLVEADGPVREAVRTRAGTVVAAYAAPDGTGRVLVQPEPAVGDPRQGPAPDADPPGPTPVALASA